MRATFTKLIYILPILLAFISIDLVGQTQAQLDEIKAYERKIEMNLDNPHFDVTTAKEHLEVLKKQYGIKTDAQTKESSVKASENGGPFSSARSSSVNSKSIEGSSATPTLGNTERVYAVNETLLAKMPIEIQAFIKNNPQSFKIVNTPTKNADQFDGITITKEQFNNVPKDVQTLILKYPDFIKIEK